MIHRIPSVCKHLVNGQCAKLHVRCLERRWFGGVPYGECKIREVYRPPVPEMKPPKSR